MSDRRDIKSKQLAAHNRKYQEEKFTVAFLIRARMFFISEEKVPGCSIGTLKMFEGDVWIKCQVADVFDMCFNEMCPPSAISACLYAQQL